MAAVSGLTDLDAITLSTGRLVAEDSLAADIGWRMILTAALVNLLFKGGIAAVLGNRRLALRTGLVFGASIAGGILILWLWPAQLVNDWLDAVLH